MKAKLVRESLDEHYDENEFNHYNENEFDDKEIRKMIDKVKSFSQFITEQKENEKTSFIEPELDYSEFFRIFNVLNSKLPSNIDKKLFDKDVYYAQIVGKKTNVALQKKFNKSNALQIKDDIDIKWYPFIDYIFKIFNNGKKTNVDVDFLKNVYYGETEDNKYGDNSFHNFIDIGFKKNDKTDDDKEYWKSFEYFDKHKNNIPLPVIINIGRKYYLSGGNRRLSWLLYRGLKTISVFLIKS